jgi:signal transduction histidine kinase
VRQALFRPFFSTKSGGLGIGLALVKRMVEQWGGRIALTPGTVKGTCVELILPLAPRAVAALEAH